MYSEKNKQIALLFIRPLLIICLLTGGLHYVKVGSPLKVKQKNIEKKEVSPKGTFAFNETPIHDDFD